MTLALNKDKRREKRTGGEERRGEAGEWKGVTVKIDSIQPCKGEAKEKSCEDKSQKERRGIGDEGRKRGSIPFPSK